MSLEFVADDLVNTGRVELGGLCLMAVNEQL